MFILANFRSHLLLFVYGICSVKVYITMNPYSNCVSLGSSSKKRDDYHLLTLILHITSFYRTTSIIFITIIYHVHKQFNETIFNW